jgi:hypothetical protein
MAVVANDEANDINLVDKGAPLDLDVKDREVNTDGDLIKVELRI